jgi:hypothetical protein
MKVPNIVVLTVVFVVGPVAYLCVAIAVFETWKPVGEYMLLALVVGPLIPESWMLAWSLAKRCSEGTSAKAD